jgi:hypothetical protein
MRAAANDIYEAMQQNADVIAQLSQETRETRLAAYSKVNEEEQISA